MANALSDLFDGCGCFSILILGVVGVGVVGVGYLFYRGYEGNPDHPQSIVFAGRITQPNHKRWLNDRLVLVFAQDLEAGRTRTNTAAFRQIVDTPTDGVFEVPLENVYGLSTTDLPNCEKREYATHITYCWLGDLQEDSLGKNFSIPSKRLDYVVRILPGKYDDLPEEMKEEGITGLVEGNIVLVSSRAQPASWLDKLLSRKTPARQNLENTPRLVESTYTDPKPEIVELPSQSETFYLDNCTGSGTTSYTSTDSKTFVREYTLQATAKAGIPFQEIEVELGAQGGYRQKQILTKTVSFGVTAKPGTNVSYKSRWNEVWERGIVTVRGPRGLMKLPFRARKDVQHFLKSDPHTCPQVSLH